MTAATSARSIRQADGLDPVRALQRVLYGSAKQDPGRRFYALFDEVARSDVMVGTAQEGRAGSGERHSPEQITGRLRVRFPNGPEMWVSPETIYQSIYVQSRGALRRDLAVCLRTGRALRRPSRKVGQRRNRIPNMINIAERPAEVKDRAVPGNWEGDLIIGKQNQTAIGTMVERQTGYAMLLHLPDGYKPEQVRDALAAKIQTLPDSLRLSLTWDQGPEMRDWKHVSIDTGIDIYFCDPHSPWHRGTNENFNGLLRQYFPKGTDFSIHSNEDLDWVAQQLNDRPAND